MPAHRGTGGDYRSEDAGLAPLNFVEVSFLDDRDRSAYCDRCASHALVSCIRNANTSPRCLAHAGERPAPASLAATTHLLPIASVCHLRTQLGALRIHALESNRVVWMLASWFCRASRRLCQVARRGKSSYSRPARYRKSPSSQICSCHWLARKSRNSETNFASAPGGGRLPLSLATCYLLLATPVRLAR